MGTKDKNSDKDLPNTPTSFDDFEAEFFASGDASSFWEKEEMVSNAKTVIAGDEDEVPDAPEPAAAEVPDAEPAESADMSADTVLHEPDEEDEEVPAGALESTVTAMGQDLPPDEDSVEIAAETPQELVAEAPEEEPEEYNPYAIHADPGALSDQDTEVWKIEDAQKLGIFDQETQVVEDPSAVDIPAPDIADAVTLTQVEQERVKAIEAPVVADVPEPPGPTYTPSEEDEGWAQASASLEREAVASADGTAKSALLSEAARIQLTRLGDWDEAARLFAAASQAGLAPENAPRAYADVAASRGDFELLKQLLVARADEAGGMAAAEALQDAALVARNNLKQDAEAVALLERALEIEDDWFTLRLLRELHHRSGDWASLTDVLSRMAGLATGTRAARVWVEHGRISESELGDLDAAAVAYDQALEADRSYMEAFLAASRLAGVREDWTGLIALYNGEADRLGGADAAFWRGRAARVARDAGLPPDEVSGLYSAAVEAAGDSPTLRHEQQAWLRQQGRMDDLQAALKAEAAVASGAAEALAWYRLGQLHETDLGDPDAALESYKSALLADPTAVPAAEAVGRILSAKGDTAQLVEFLQGRLEANTTAGIRATIAFRMGELCETQLGDLDGAKSHYSAALEIRPGSAAALMGLQRVCDATEDWARLVEICLLRARSSGDAQVTADVLYRAAQVSITQLDQADEGLDHLIKALRQVPDHSAALEAAVQMLCERSRELEAAGLLKAAAARTRTADSAVQYGYRAARLFAERCDDAESAIACLRRCRELQPGFLPAVGFLGDLYVSTGQWQLVHDLRREQAGIMGSGSGRDWELLSAAEAIQNVADGDPEAVALEILDRSPGHAGALAMLESAALRDEDTARLLQIYGRMVRAADPELAAQTLARVADVAQDVDDDGATLRAVRDVVDAEGTSGRPLEALARIAVSLDRWSDAHRALEAAGEGAAFARARLLEAFSEDLDAVALAWRSLLEANAEDTEAASGLERTLSRKGSREGLAEVHARLADHVPDGSIRAMHSLLAGHLFEHQEDQEQAIAYYEKAFRLRTVPGKAFEALVRMRVAGSNVEAIDALFDALPSSAPAQRAQALEQAGAGARAAEVYRAELDALPADAPAFKVLPSLIALEHSLEEAEDWPAVSECLARRAALSQSDEEKAAIENKRRWILAEKLADSEEAWDFYRGLHEERPEDREVLEALARIAGARGETSLAIQFLDGLSNIAETPEEAARYQRRVAEVHISAGADDSAREAFLRALDHKDDDGAAIEGLEDIARRAEDWQALVGVLARRARIVDGREQVEIHREVARIWETQIEDQAVAVDSWKKVLELVPEDPDALEHLVGLARAREQWSALVEYGSALAPHITSEARAALLCEVGIVTLERLDREDQAVTYLDRASTGESLSLEAAQALEGIHTRRGDWAKVVEAIMRQARASDGEAAAQLYLKAARTRRDALHDRRGAAEIYDQVLQADPGNPEALRYRGDHLFDAGNLAKAAEVYAQLDGVEQELDLDDFDVQMEQALFFFRFGECLRQTGQQEAALERYQGALGLNKSHLPTLEAIGPLYIDMGMWSEAADVFKHILQLTSGRGNDAQLARVYTNLGRVEYAQGNEAKALKRFNKALELEANDVMALSGYAKILFDKQDWNTLLNVYNNIIYHAQEPAAAIEAYLVKGFVLDAKMSLPDKAAQHYERSLAFDAAQPVALMRLAELALRKQDWAQARSLADRALGLEQVETLDSVQANLYLVRAVASSADGDEAAVSGAVAAAKSADAGLGEQLGPDDSADAMHDLLRGRLQASL